MGILVDLDVFRHIRSAFIARSKQMWVLSIDFLHLFRPLSFFFDVGFDHFHLVLIDAIPFLAVNETAQSGSGCRIAFLDRFFTFFIPAALCHFWKAFSKYYNPGPEMIHGGSFSGPVQNCPYDKGSKVQS